MNWFNRGLVIKVLALLLAVLSFWHYEVKGPDFEEAHEIAVNDNK